MNARAVGRAEHQSKGEEATNGVLLTHTIAIREQVADGEEEGGLGWGEDGHWDTRTQATKHDVSFVAYRSRPIT